MKNTLVLLASFALVTAIAIAARPSSSLASRPVDDPPPEPIDCPLCGGNPAVHARKMIDLESLCGRVLTYTLRW